MKKKLWQPSANKSRFPSVSMKKKILKIVKGMQFRSVRVLKVQMRFMMEAANLCCNFDRIFFLNKFVIDILTKYLSSLFIAQI